MLRVAIKEAHADGGDKLRKVADALVDKALTGDVPAIKEIADRLDGKVPQAIEGEMNHTADETIAGLLGRIATSGASLVAIPEE
jgi:hypothetical protein